MVKATQEQYRNILELIAAMEEQPGLFVTRHDVHQIKLFLTAFRTGRMWGAGRDDGFGDELVGRRFTDWVRAKYNFTDDAMGWANMLHWVYGDVDHAQARFFSDFGEYCALHPRAIATYGGPINIHNQQFCVGAERYVREQYKKHYGHPLPSEVRITFSHSNYRNQPSADIRIAVKSDQLAEALNQICGHTVAPQYGELYVAHFSDARHWDPDITINTATSGNLIPIPSSIEQFYSVFSEIWEFVDQHALPLANDIIEMDPRVLRHVAHCPCNRLMAAIAVAVVEKHGLLASDPLVHEVLKADDHALQRHRHTHMGTAPDRKPYFPDDLNRLRIFCTHGAEAALRQRISSRIVGAA